MMVFFAIVFILLVFRSFWIDTSYINNYEDRGQYIQKKKNINRAMSVVFFMFFIVAILWYVYVILSTM